MKTRSHGGASWRDHLDTAIAVAAFICAIVLLWNTWASRSNARRTSVRNRNDVVSFEGAPRRGDPKAKFAIVMYSDYQCSFCARAFQEVLPTIERKYVATGRVLFVLRQFPLPAIHPLSLAAAVAAQCAARQDKFWPLHHRLYTYQGRLDLTLIRNDAVAVGADMTLWDSCMDSADSRAAVDREVTAAREVGVRGTPTFLIGRMQSPDAIQVFKEIDGLSTIAHWRSALDAALANAR